MKNDDDDDYDHNVDKNSEAVRVINIAVIEGRHLVLFYQLFFDIAHKCICHELPEWRAHSNPVHLLVQISFKLKKLMFRSNL